MTKTMAFQEMAESERVKLVAAYDKYIQARVALNLVINGSYADSFSVCDGVYARRPYNAPAVNIQRYRDALDATNAAFDALVADFGRPDIDFPTYFTVKHVHNDSACKGLKRNSANRSPECEIVAAAGMSERQLIETYREHVCTHCFPEAPVEEMRSEAKRRKADEVAALKAAREAKKAEKAIAMPDGSPLKDTMGWRIETAATAKSRAVDAYVEIKTWDNHLRDHANYARIRGEYATLLADAVIALAHKYGQTAQEVEQEIAAKGEKKYSKTYYGKGN